MDRTTTLTSGLLALALVFSVINFMQLGSMQEMMGSGMGTQMNPATGMITAPPTTPPAQIELYAGLPKGVPPVYGAELGISYDDVSADSPQKADATIRKLATLDQSITLEGEAKERYIKTLLQISCEYCCGAESIIFANGEAACGCAHSFAMRGVAKYILTEHPDEYTDDQILEELGKWKALFFPTQISQKAVALESNGIPLNFINLSSNAYRGIEKGSGSGMVGGC
ncbi:MAG: hypothetical protein Q8P05_04210 [Candidatus Diapherotrites archaeon]|nr:hypothetical protein [Candidatus Diapherotrites archaeon]MDZ4256621.1 hypothetical protein [archaeon]